MNRLLRLTRKGSIALLILTLAAAVAGCGGGKSKDGGGDADLKNGKAKFQANCKSCHTLADANANGSFGGSLDIAQPSEERTLQQIKTGGGGMPENLVEGQDAKDVAAYVAQKAGR